MSNAYTSILDAMITQSNLISTYVNPIMSLCKPKQWSHEKINTLHVFYLIQQASFLTAVRISFCVLGNDIKLLTQKAQNLFQVVLEVQNHFLMHFLMPRD